MWFPVSLGTKLERLKQTIFMRNSQGKPDSDGVQISFPENVGGISILIAPKALNIPAWGIAPGKSRSPDVFGLKALHINRAEAIIVVDG